MGTIQEVVEAVLDMERDWREAVIRLIRMSSEPLFFHDLREEYYDMLEQGLQRTGGR